jgi:hypothetical protein
MKLAARAEIGGPVTAEDRPWRDRAAQLRLAGLADHLILLPPGAPEGESALVAPVLDHVNGPLFRLAPGCYAAIAPDPAAAAAALAPDVRLEEIAPSADAAGPEEIDGSDIVMLGPLTDAAMRAGGPRMVIDADFAIETAGRASKAIAAAAAEAGRQRGRAQAVRTSADIASRKRIAKRLEGIEASVDALRDDGAATRLDALDAVLSDLKDALTAAREETRARATAATDQLDAMAEALAVATRGDGADRAAILAALDAQAAAAQARAEATVAALADIAAQVGAPDPAAEREGLMQLSAEIQVIAQRLDDRIARLAETVAPLALADMEARLSARIDAAIARKDERSAAAVVAMAEFLAVQTRSAEGVGE